MQFVCETVDGTTSRALMNADGAVLNDWSFPPVADRSQNVMMIGHCGAPITPHGNDRIPYLIRDHIHSNKKWFGPDDVPAATTVFWPTDETVTVAKFDVSRRKVSVYVGTVLDGNLLVDDFDNRICHNKMVVRIQHPERCYMLPSDPKEGGFRGLSASARSETTALVVGKIADERNRAEKHVVQLR